jgi:hypothetical protein
MSSRTSSQSKLAKAWMHFPGHSLESAVFVIVPRRPEKIVVTVYAFFTNIAVQLFYANLQTLFPNLRIRTNQKCRFLKILICLSEETSVFLKSTFK